MVDCSKYKGYMPDYLYVPLCSIDPRVLQEALGVEPDGIIGRHTLRALVSVDPEMLYTNLAESFDAPPSRSREDKLMDYLGKAEGLVVHWNKGEKDFTTPYGVYAYANPTAKVVLYVHRLATKYGVSLRHRDLKALARLNKALTRQERDTIRHLAYELYADKYMDAKVAPFLSDKEYLTFFSNSVNAGLTTGRRMLQCALGSTADGKIGQQTLNKLANKPANLNDKMLHCMGQYYATLIRRNPAKYSRYRKGWNNRLRGLA